MWLSLSVASVVGIVVLLEVVLYLKFRRVPKKPGIPQGREVPTEPSPPTTPEVPRLESQWRSFSFGGPTHEDHVSSVWASVERTWRGVEEQFQQAEQRLAEQEAMLARDLGIRVEPRRTPANPEAQVQLVPAPPKVIAKPPEAPSKTRYDILTEDD